MSIANKNKNNKYVLPGYLVFLCTAFAIDIDDSWGEELLVPGETVWDRPREELDAKGLPVRSFRLYPVAELGLGRDSNIFALRENEVEDQIVIFTPSLSLESQWVRHTLALDIDAEIAQYDDNDTEDYEDMHLAAQGALDLGSRQRVGALIEYDEDHERRGSPDDQRGLAPTTFEEQSASLFHSYSGARLRTRLDGGIQEIRFDDTKVAGGFIDNEDRDKDIRSGELEISYELSSDLDVAIRYIRDQHDYTLDQDRNGFQRDSDGQAVGIGPRGTITGSLYADLIIGVTRRNYADAALPDIEKTWVDAKVVWNMSGLSSVTLAADRDIWDSRLADVSGSVRTMFDARLDHELARNLIISIAAFRGRDEFIGTERTDDLSGYRVDATYMLNRYLQLSVGFTRNERDSNTAVNDFDRNIVMFSLRTQL